MPDAFAHCEALVRAADRERFLTALFAPANRRNALFALYAFNVEIARVRDAVREPLAGEIRLQWWSDALTGSARGDAEANPVMAALKATVVRFGLALDALQALVGARRFDLYDEPMATMAELEAYAEGASAGLIGLAGRILAAVRSPKARPWSGTPESLMRLRDCWRRCRSTPRGAKSMCRTTSYSGMVRSRPI
jgi:phytoene synthase